MKVRDELISKTHHEVSDVLCAALDVTTADRAHADWLTLNQIIHDRKIMRSEIPEHIDVALKQPEVDAY